MMVFESKYGRGFSKVVGDRGIDVVKRQLKGVTVTTVLVCNRFDRLNRFNMENY